MWRGSRANWQDQVRHVLRSDGQHMIGLHLLDSPPANERRLILVAPSKAARALFVGAMRKSQGHIYARAVTTPQEEANKLLVRAFAAKRNLLVIDHGDRVFLRVKGAPVPQGAGSR